MLKALVGAGGRSQENGCEVVLAGFAQIFGGFFDGEIGDQNAVDSGETSDLAELREAHAQDGIEVGEDHQSDGLGMFADFGGECEHVLERCSVLEGALAGALDDWSIGERVAEGNSEFDHACTCVDGCENHIACGDEVGIAAGYVDDQRRLAFEVERHKSIVDCGGLFGVERKLTTVKESDSIVFRLYLRESSRDSLYAVYSGNSGTGGYGGEIGSERGEHCIALPHSSQRKAPAVYSS